MKKTAAIIVVMALVTGFLSYRLIIVENQRYALIVGMCPGNNIPTLPDLKCLATVQTRTHWLWHLYYGLTD